MPRGSIPSAKTLGISRGSVVVASVVAVVSAAVLIALSVASVSGEGSGKTDSGSSVATGDTGSIQTTSYQGLANGKSLGSADAPVTIIEFAEAQCGVCQDYALTTEKQLIERYVATGKVRLVFKHFVVFGDESMQAAAAAEAAAEQNKFWEYRGLLMAVGASPKVEGDLSEATLRSLAEQVGLDMDAFNAAFLSEKSQANVARDAEEGAQLQVWGTPTFFINGEKVETYLTFEDFEEHIDALLEQTTSAD